METETTKVETTGMELTADNVKEVILKCLYAADEIDKATGQPKAGMPQPLVVKGIRLQIGFNPDRLATQQDNIKSMLKCLPKEFHSEPVGNGGWTFLNMCTTTDGSLWGEHESCDRLLVMGLASGLMDFVIADRTIWAAFPGHMPYVLTTPELYA